MSMYIQSLPPKMAVQYGEKALAGKADNVVGDGWYEFYLGNNVTSVLATGDGSYMGYVQKVSSEEMKRRREKAKPGSLIEKVST